MKRRTLLQLAPGAVPAVLLAAAKPGWLSLFDGRTLDGWKATGNAAWSVEDGAIVGRQGPGGAAGDLFSVERWKDFEVEAEWKMRWPGNSGLWFRYAGPRTGYQADFLDQPSHPGVLSGSLYCMGKAFIAENRDPASVLKNGWNRLRIRAAGNDLRIIQNGRKVVEVADDTFPGPGRVGIQVHAGAHFKGMEVRVRGIRLRVIA